MATLQCRACGANVSTDTRRTRCACGELFPLECAVCQKPLRPPLLVFPDERHLTENFEPLCEEHYQRQCPDCGTWFRADENPGYFRCLSCAAASSRVAQEASRELETSRLAAITREHAASSASGPTPSADPGSSGVAVLAAEPMKAKTRAGGCLASGASLLVFGLVGLSGLGYFAYSVLAG